MSPWSVSSALLFWIVAMPLLWSQRAVVPSQEPSYARDPASVPIALSKLQKGDYGLVDIEILAEARATAAIPAMKAEFSKAADLDTKGKIAGALLRLGDRNAEYWDFLVARATETLGEDAPSPIGFSPDGAALPNPPEEFMRWAASRNRQPSNAFEDAAFSAPGTISDLAQSGDRRAVPLLRQALRARNYLVEAAGALGLADLQDKESIPLIVDACRQAPREAAEGIAESLVYFDDPGAQNAVDMFIPKDHAAALRTSRAHGGGPFR